MQMNKQKEKKKKKKTNGKKKSNQIPNRKIEREKKIS